MQSLNTELQNKLLGQSGQLIDSSKKISELSKEAIELTTGAESFCYMWMNMFDVINKHHFPIFYHRGKQPLYDMRVRITSLEKLNEWGPILFPGIVMTIGTLAPNSKYQAFDQDVPVSDSPRQDLVIFFDARNGGWEEDLQMRQVDNPADKMFGSKMWVQASRVRRVVTDKNGIESRELIYMECRREFSQVSQFGLNNSTW